MNVSNRKRSRKKAAASVHQVQRWADWQSWVKRADRVPLLLICLFMVVGFIPPLGASDVIGSQWVYLGVVNLLSVLFIVYDRKNNSATEIKIVSGNILSIGLFILLILCGISVFIALNKIESLVCYARFVEDVIMYFNLAVLLYGRLNLFKLLAQLISIILLIQSIQVLYQFFNGLNDMEWDKLILSLQGNAGHKNILAASMVIKLPFTVYCIYTAKIWAKTGSILILFLAVLTISFLNARSAYVIIILQVICYGVFCFTQYFQERNWRQTGLRLSYFVLPVAISIFLSLVIVNHEKGAGEQRTEYGTIVERLGTMSFTVEGSDSRLFFWRNAAEYLKKHPLLGSGFGNWKLAAIPYEKDYLNDLKVSYHVHNDFLEMAATTGILGGLLYLSIFIMGAICLMRTFLTKSNNEIKIITVFISLALVGYITDAFFNFPLERPVMQFFFCFLLALGLNAYLSVKPRKEPQDNKDTRIIKYGFGLLVILFLIPSSVINYIMYKSLVAQKTFNMDMQQEKPELTLQDLYVANFPSIPNMNEFCFPIDAIKARYLIDAGKYDDALVLLNSSAGVNPYIAYNEYLKGHLFLATNRPDSALYYAMVAINKRPRSRAIYLLVNAACLKLKDSITVEKTFREMVQRRNEPWVWEEYITSLFILKANKQKLMAITDSALKLFPLRVTQRLNQIKAGLQNMISDTTRIQQIDPQKYQQLLAEATASYNKKNYTAAISGFKKAAEMNPGDYTSYENTGLCYYFKFDFKNAMPWFDKVIKMKSSTDGKSEFFKALCLIYMNRRAEACPWLRMANVKNYKDAKSYLAANCGGG